MLNVPGYTVSETVREDKDFVLVRGQRNDDSLNVLIEGTVPERAGEDGLERLEHEYGLRDELDSAWAVRPIDQARTDAGTALVFADPGGETLDRILENPLPLGDALRIAIGTAAALEKLHKRNIIHKDIKPGNILVDRAAGTVWLMGFGIASPFPREFREPEPPEVIAGTLAYMAPEQTGRMNRSIDSRSDLYSLGVTLYEMVAGAPPFTAGDPMEWIHCHIARLPPPPSERNRGLPPPISQIVMKLMAKHAEDRYQTAKGVESDLKRCLEEWSAMGRVNAFPLASRDGSGRMLIPEKLYGREKEVRDLLNAFGRVEATGLPEMVLVSGYSGAGKSSLVNELHKVIVPPKGLYATGKIEPHHKDAPYFPFAQAFRTLVRKILSMKPGEMGAWRDAIREAVGRNGRLLTELIPDLGFLIGQPDPVPELSPLEAQNRFHAAFRAFLGVFARHEHPLALFFDDLQWWDSASLKLLEHVSTHPDIRHLLLIGAYRDNEVGPAHPLRITLDAVRRTGAIVREIALATLPLSEVQRIVADTLHCAPPAAEPLARLVHEKTAGNPFFTIQFLRLLHEDRLLEYDEEGEAWKWDMESIRAEQFTDNVVDLMVEKLKRLPVPAQEALKRAACIGISADASALARIYSGSEQQAHIDLLPAVLSGLVFRVGDNYRFLHDRVQEAAYSLIPEASRKAEHLRIGRLLMEGMTGAEAGEKGFLLVNQFNRGLELVTDPKEKDVIRGLNAAAGRKAKAASAYESARGFLFQAESLLPPDAWAADYGETFPITLELAECEYLVGNSEQADALTESALDHAVDSLDRAKVCHLRIKPYLLAGRFNDALRSGLKGLDLLGVTFPDREEDRQAGIAAGILEVESNMRGRRWADLLGAPMAADPDVRAIIALIAVLGPVAYATKSSVFPLLILKGVNLSLRAGNTEDSCCVYSYYALLQASLFDGIPAAYEFSDFALRLNRKSGDPRPKPMLLLVHGYAISFWLRPFGESVSVLEQAFAAGLETGDFIYAGYAAILMAWYHFEKGESFFEVRKASERYSAFAEQVRHRPVYEVIRMEQQFLACLQGSTRGPACFDDPSFIESEVLDHLASSGYTAGVAYHSYMKQIAAYLYRMFDVALEFSLKAETQLVEVGGSSFVASHCFYHALTLAALFPDATEDRRSEYLETIRKNLARLKRWSEYCPANFRGRYFLVAAEKARIERRDLEAMRLYDEAIGSARENGFLLIESLACELAARFHQDRGFGTIAGTYLRLARSGYLRWGAHGKVRQLDETRPAIGGSDPWEGAGTIETPIARLDSMAVVKAAQAVSGEMVLADLVRTLLTIAVQHAGAERGLLMLPRDDGSYLVQAEASTREDDIEVRIRNDAIRPGDLPDSMVQFVLRTRERVLLDDASAPNPFSEDEYLAHRRPRSVLCLPLVKQTKPVGALYLENNLVPHAFTPDRIAVLDVIAGQAAISLENALLFEGLKRAEERFSKAFRNSPTPMAIALLRDYRLVDVNDRLLETFGFAREEMIGRTPAELGIVDQGLLDQALGLIAEKGSFRDVELIPRSKSGNSLVILASVETIELDGEQCSLSTYIDITQSKAVEGQLRQSQKMEAVGRLAGGVAHDFNNLLTAINGYSSLLLEGIDPTHPHYASLREILKSGERAALLTKQLLAHSRKQILRPQIWNLNDIVRDIVPMLKRLIGEDVAMGTDLAPDLGMVRVDRGQVEQVLMNLVINARDAMPKGGKLTLQTRNVELGEAYLGTHLESYPGHNAMLAVIDTGSGMTSEVKARLFEPFFTTKALGEGTGLGLSVVYGIVKQSGGSISVYSEPELGTTFRIYFPLTRSPGETIRDPSIPEDADAHRGDETILLVEDEDPVRKFTSLALESQGYSVLQARNGVEGLQALRKATIAIQMVITDVIMPEMGGVELAKRIRKLDPGLPVLFISGYAQRIESPFLQKPFTPIELFKKVREVLDRVGKKAETKP